MISGLDPGANDFTIELVSLSFAAIAYYLGAFIRHSVRPSSELPFYKQALMGIPLFIALAVVLLTALKTATQSSHGVLSQTLGVLLIFLENGMVINEAWSRQLQNLIDGRKDSI